VLEKKDEPLEVRGVEFAVDAVKGMRDGMGERLGLKVLLEIKDVVAQTRDVGMLSLRKPPNEQVNFAWILRKISRNLLANKSIAQRRNRE